MRSSLNNKKYLLACKAICVLATFQKSAAGGVVQYTAEEAYRGCQRGDVESSPRVGTAGPASCWIVTSYGRGWDGARSGIEGGTGHAQSLPGWYGQSPGIWELGECQACARVLSER